jgi:hypothetical protein
MNNTTIPVIDLVVLSRSAEPLRVEVEDGIRSQQGVRIVIHRVVGSVRASDRCRWETIARARNTGKQLGSTPWLMFLDDDVVLAPDCIATLLKELNSRPIYAALGADYSAQQHPGQIAGHVSMGATLFRRAVLDQIEFRWVDQRCECQCCCDDLRGKLWAVDYLPTAHAEHLTTKGCDSKNPSQGTASLCCDRQAGRHIAAAPTVCLVVCYLGRPPGWIEYYLKSCASNPTIEFLIFSDYDDFPEVPPNVRLVRFTGGEFNRLASWKLGLDISLSHARKLCDFKPLYGHLFEEYLAGFDYWGYTDLDVIYGDLRSSLTAARFSEYDVFTARQEFLVGHFTLFRNTEMLRKLYEQSRDFRKTLAVPQVLCFDECGQEWWDRLQGNSCDGGKSFDSMTHTVSRLMEDRQLRVCFEQQVLEWPQLSMTDWRVRWEDGRLRLMHPRREVMYCHFHAFKHQLGYRLPPSLGDEACFDLTAIGIGPTSRIRRKKNDEELLPSLAGTNS